MKKSIFSNKFTAVLVAMVVSMLWGTLFPTIKIGYRVFGIDSTQVAAILLFAGVRFLISGVILVGADSVRRKGVCLPTRKQFGSIFAVSMLTVVLHYAFTYSGLSLAESSKSSVLKQIAFLVVPAIVCFFRKDDRFSMRKLFAAMLGFMAVLAVSMDGTSFRLGAGEILIILASFSSMFGNLVSKNVYDKEDPVYIVAYGQLFGGIVLVAVGLLFGGRIGHISWESIGVLAYICAASITANLLWNTLIKYNDMSRLAVLKSMDPLFASLFSALLLRENIWKITYLVAVALVICAVLVSNNAGKKAVKQ